MSEPAHKHSLDKRDWLDTARAELAGGGISAVVIGAMHRLLISLPSGNPGGQCSGVA